MPENNFFRSVLLLTLFAIFVFSPGNLAFANEKEKRVKHCEKRCGSAVDHCKMSARNDENKLSQELDRMKNEAHHVHAEINKVEHMKVKNKAGEKKQFKEIEMLKHKMGGVMHERGKLQNEMDKMHKNAGRCNHQRDACMHACMH